MNEQVDTAQNGNGHIVNLKGMYKDYFLDYASYVILERAVPSIFDGLKPVQRRILHSMKNMDDGRYHKVANIIGNSMQYHPHGDAAIGDALVNLSSLTYWLPTPIQPTYVATKCFLASLSESLWYQARSRGVYVQGLCPGLIRTRFLERAGLKRFMGLLDLLSATPERVVDVSLRAMHRRRGPIVIPGWGNKTIAVLCRVLPRRLLVAVMGRACDFAQREA